MASAGGKFFNTNRNRFRVTSRILKLEGSAPVLAPNL
jgi:hypothetical protein